MTVKEKEEGSFNRPKVKVIELRRNTAGDAKRAGGIFGHIPNVFLHILMYFFIFDSIFLNLLV